MSAAENPAFKGLNREGPTEGLVHVQAITGAATNQYIDLQTAFIADLVGRMAKITIASDQAMHLKFSPTNTNGNDPAAVAGATRVMGPFPASIPVEMRIPGGCRYLGVHVGTTANVRVYCSEGQW